MFVIADIEWIQNKANLRSLTQLAAAKVDEGWNVIEEFSTYIKPKDNSFFIWDDPAFNGESPDSILFLRDCHTALEIFEKWLNEDDILCWWAQDSRDTYNVQIKHELKIKTPRASVILSYYIKSFLNGQGFTNGTAYKLAKARNIEVPEVEHCSKNDVTAIVSLIKGIQFPQDLLKDPPNKPGPVYNNPGRKGLDYQYDATNGLLHKNGCPLMPDRADTLAYGTLLTCINKKYKPCSCIKDELLEAKRQKVIDEISKLPYTFLYAENGKVYHRRECHLLCNANHVLGTTKYRTVQYKGMRPCKVCKPQPELEAKQMHVQPRNANKLLGKPPKRSKSLVKSLAQTPERDKKIAIIRLEQSQKERFSGILETELTQQEKEDLFTLTQPGVVFFAAYGYQNFHLRNCTRFAGLSNVRGFDTFENAKKAGYTPCRQCKPSEKMDLTVSIPINNQIRPNETVEDLLDLCEKFGYGCRNNAEYFEVETSVGKWRIVMSSYPVCVDHINLVKTPGCKKYHTQHRVFLSRTDAIYYIHKHDSVLMRKSSEENI